MSTPATAKQINTLLAALSLQLSENNADDALQSINDLNNLIKSWCEDEVDKPTNDELVTLQKKINTLLSTASDLKADTLKSLLKHKQSNKAISAYKST